MAVTLSKRLEEAARLVAQDIQSRRTPRKVHMYGHQRAAFDARVAELVDPPTDALGIPSPSMSPSGYIDPPTADRLAKLAARWQGAEEELHAALQEAADLGISFRTMERVTGISHRTIHGWVTRRREAEQS